MHYKIAQDRHQTTLFNSLEDMISEDNIVRLIDLLIEKIAESYPEKFSYKGESAIGCKSYSPLDLMKLYLYGYLNRISSSRRLEAETQRNIEVKWLLGNLQPDFKTIANYRKDNKEAIRFVCLSFRTFLKDTLYIEGKKITYDGSKVKACTATDKVKTIAKLSKQLEHVEKELEAYLSQLQQNDSLEKLDNELENISEKYDLNQALLDKIAKLTTRIEELEKQKQTIKDSGYNDYCANDPQAHLMKSRDGFIPAYNVQAGTDAKHKMLVLAEVTSQYNDLHALEANHQKVKQLLGIEPEIIEADKGYANLEQIQSIESNKITTCAIPLQTPSFRDKEKDKKNGVTFLFNKQESCYQCCRGNKLKPNGKVTHSRSIYIVYQANAAQCKQCSLWGKCTTSKKGRSYKVKQPNAFEQQYKERLKTSEIKKLINERKDLIEHVFGTIKRWMGKVPILLTSQKKVQIEIDLYATVYNLKRLFNVETMPIIMEKLANYNFKTGKSTLLKLFLLFFTFYSPYKCHKTSYRFLVI